MPGGSETSDRAPDDRRRPCCPCPPPELKTTSLQQTSLPVDVARSLLPAAAAVVGAVVVKAVETPAAKTSVGFTHIDRAGSVVKSAKIDQRIPESNNSSHFSGSKFLFTPLSASSRNRISTLPGLLGREHSKAEKGSRGSRKTQNENEIELSNQFKTHQTILVKIPSPAAADNNQCRLRRHRRRSHRPWGRTRRLRSPSRRRRRCPRWRRRRRRETRGGSADFAAAGNWQQRLGAGNWRLLGGNWQMAAAEGARCSVARWRSERS